MRGYHDTIKGIDARGRKYHALDPDTFYWAHATFFYSLVVSVEWFDGPLPPLADKHRLFDEHVQWYRLYGMSMRPVPPESWEAFLGYWDHMCRNVLEDNKAPATSSTCRTSTGRRSCSGSRHRSGGPCVRSSPADSCG